MGESSSHHQSRGTVLRLPVWRIMLRARAGLTGSFVPPHLNLQERGSPLMVSNPVIYGPREPPRTTIPISNERSRISYLWDGSESPQTLGGQFYFSPAMTLPISRVKLSL